MKQFLKKIVAIILATEAAIVIKKYKPKIIAVTGNVGKTSAKDAIFASLSRELFIRKSEKSFNSEIGVPLTILGCQNAWNDPFLWAKNILRGLELIFFREEYPKFLILEVGADHPGDIRSISKWLSPDVVVVTRIPEVPVHIEFFTSRGELIDEKANLITALKKGGTLILNADDADVLRLRERNKSAKVVTFGIEKPADFHASGVTLSYGLDGNMKVLSGVEFVLDKNGENKVKLSGVVGIQHVYPVIISVAVANEFGIDAGRALQPFASYTPPAGRMNILRGIHKSVIIDDTYNSSPIALHEALLVLKNAHSGGRKIAVLGDMLELGMKSNQAHHDAGTFVAKVADILVTVGMRAKKMGDGALDAGMKANKIFSFENSSEAGKFLEGFILKKDLLLVKGSQGARMEKVIEKILEDVKSAPEVLVRQEEEWKKR
ncbi:MAG: UDP-N-acetylmuramoyl-tripeptide--D-alanyl-D-alanine ligase [bacterium]